MIILGLNAYHPDSSACLLIDGKVVIAIEEERINRIKHWSGLPILSIKECLNKKSLSLKDIDHVVMNTSPSSNLLNKIKFIICNKIDYGVIWDKFKNTNKKNLLLKTIAHEIGDTFNGRCKLNFIEHHLAHVASAYFDSPYDKSVNLSIDGFGDFASLSWGVAEKNKIIIKKKILFPHSLGTFYEAFTQFLGFNNWGDEYKIMGLSSYGTPNYVKEVEKIIQIKKFDGFKLNLDYFEHHKKNIINTWANTGPRNEDLFNNKIEKLFFRKRNFEEPLEEKHRNVAASVQFVYEKIIFSILNEIYPKYQIENLTLSGGCAQNSSANGKILSNTNFKSLFVPANPGDGGGSVGAAYALWSNISKKRPTRNNNAYLGSSFTDQDIEAALTKEQKALDVKNYEVKFIPNDSQLIEYVANQITNNKIIGWYQNGMEWGPRALGNRSILADPRNKNIREELNIKIKKREIFRPFAPSILLEEASNWFENFNEEIPYMSQVLKFKKDKRSLVPAVSHIDGTGRLQTVTEKNNLRFYNLIKFFFSITDVPILLNTSFNENEPIVNKPEEAINCFLRTKMDLLVLKNHIIIRR
jgi:carbamoyltransferase